MAFLITAFALTAVVSAILVLTLTRTRSDAEHPAAYDLRVYRDQLKEVDRDLARGVLSAEDAERARAEVGRRVLAADAQLQEVESGSAQPKAATIGVSIAVALALLGGGFGIYSWLGAPGTRDLPLKERIAQSDQKRLNRPPQAEAEANLPSPSLQEPAPEFAELMSKLLRRERLVLVLQRREFADHINTRNTRQRDDQGHHEAVGEEPVLLCSVVDER